MILPLARELDLILLLTAIIMRVLETQDSVLTNGEVVARLQEARHARSGDTSTSGDMKDPNFETITKEVLDYFRQEEGKPLTEPTGDPGGVRLQSLMSSLKEYSLTKSETLMICNLRPLDVSLLDCIIEDSDGRLTEEQQAMILDKIASH